MRTRKALTLATIICSLLITTSVLAADTSPAPITLKETITSIDRVPGDCKLISLSSSFWPISSPDFTRVAYVVEKEGQGLLVVDGNIMPARHKFGEEVHLLEVGTIVIFHRAGFSPDSKRFAYVAFDGDKELAVVDEIEGRHYDEILASVKFSPDSAHFAYAAREGEEEFLVVDGKELRRHGTIGGPYFSSDSNRVAYFAHRRPLKLMGVVTLRRQRFEGIGLLTLAPTSSVPAYAPSARAKGFVFVGAEEIAPGDNPDWISFSDDLLHNFYFANRGGKDFVVLDGKRQWEHIYKARFIPDSLSFAFVGRNGRDMSVYVGGRKGKGYDLINALVFSADFQRFAYSARKGESWFIVLDDEETKTHGRAKDRDLFFSPDSKRFAYVDQIERDNREDWEQFVVVDGKEGPHYQRLEFPTLTFSPDSTRLAYLAREGEKEFVVVDGTQGHHYEEIRDGPIFSPDSAHVAYVAEKNDQYVVVVDGVETSSRFSDVVLRDYLLWSSYIPSHSPFRSYSIAFDSSTHLTAAFMRDPGPEFLRLEVEILPAPENQEAE